MERAPALLWPCVTYGQFDSTVDNIHSNIMFYMMGGDFVLSQELGSAWLMLFLIVSKPERALKLIKSLVFKVKGYFHPPTHDRYFIYSFIFVSHCH